MDEVALNDLYEPQHQYQEPNEEVERQLNVSSSSDIEPQVIRRKSVLPPDAGRVSRITEKAKGYGRFWFDHVKKGEMPWTQWHCCGIVEGNEVS